VPRVHRSRARGQSLAEFAITLPLFLLLLFGLIDFSRLLFTYVSLTNGTRELARMAALSSSWPSSTAPIDAFNNLTIIGAPPAHSGDTDQVTITWVNSYCQAHGGPPCTAPGALMTVTCPLPLSSATCSLPANRSLYYDGYVQVITTYTFRFSPLFQDGLAPISFMRSLTNLSTSVQETIE
jgi:hypothetical protein